MLQLATPHGIRWIANEWRKGWAVASNPLQMDDRSICLLNYLTITAAAVAATG
jgi:hypothetical protein